MKLFRKDLQSGFKDQLFEINANSLGLIDKLLLDGPLNCLLSSEIIHEGFRLKGTLKVGLFETCDRCLKKYSGQVNSNFKLILTSNISFIKDKNENMLWFPETDDYIDLKNIIQDLFSLEEPMKKICSVDCKGLCQKCGSDLNRETCTCNYVNN